MVIEFEFVFGWMISCVGPLSSSFPSLLRIVINKMSWVKECYGGYGGFLSWVVPFRHSLRQYEESEFGSLLSLLSNVFLYRGEADAR